MSGRFQDMHCVVTGGVNGIGRCITERFLKEGAFVTVIDKDEATGRAFQSMWPDKLFFFHGDVAKQEDLEGFAQFACNTFSDREIHCGGRNRGADGTECLGRIGQAEGVVKAEGPEGMTGAECLANDGATYGGLDCLINNACLSRDGLLSGCSYEDFNYVLRTGLTAPYYLSKLFAGHFNANASIVNISSTRAFMSQPDTESYSAAKGGVTALTHALCMSLSGKVRVNSISPGWIDTENWQGAATLGLERELDDAGSSREKDASHSGDGNCGDSQQTRSFNCGDNLAYVPDDNHADPVRFAEGGRSCEGGAPHANSGTDGSDGDISGTIITASNKNGSPCPITGSHTKYQPSDLLQHPSGRVGVPDDIASLVMYLCSAEARFINGENVIVDGGMTKHMVYHNDWGWQFESGGNT